MKRSYLNIAGAVLLFAGLLNIYAHLGTEGWRVLFWYSNFSAILGAIGILTKRNYIVNAVLFTAIPLEAPWVFDFIRVLFGGDSIGFSQWVFYEKNMLIVFSTIFLHTILIPIAFYGTYVLGFSRKSFPFMVFIYFLFLAPATYIFTDSSMNTNCVFRRCGFLKSGVVESPLMNLLYYYGENFLVACVSFLGVMFFFKKILKKDPLVS
ncbi:MAG: hypothetical protein AAB770_00575 [Patescibacteria group bacterium]